MCVCVCVCVCISGVTNYMETHLKFLRSQYYLEYYEEKLTA